MKSKAMILACLIGAVVLSLCFEYSQAEPKTEGRTDKMGVVSIARIFMDCKKSARYRQEAIAEQKKVTAELDKLKAEIDAQEAGLKTLKTESSDYLVSMKGLLEKRANLQVQQEFYKQQVTLREWRWTRELYRDILRETSKVAEQKGLDLVFGEDEVDFTEASVNELVLTMRTHKLLYSAGCLDITGDVIARLDAEESKNTK